MEQSEIKGFDLSTDYKTLWNLIHEGYRIPAWITYSKEYAYPIFDLVEVKMVYMSDRYSIGTRGVGYDTFDSTFEQFEMCCKNLELRWISLSSKITIQ